MDEAFWHRRWQRGEIRFHQREVNKLLMKHWPSVAPDPAAAVFVPLAGKSHDMTWLAERGHRVIGVELSNIAVEEFFAEQGLRPERRQEGAFEVSSARIGAGWVELWCGDFFAMPREALAGVTAAYDRASLIALPPEMRGRYAAKMVELLAAHARTLLLTFCYDQSQMAGPPFSVADDEVARLYGGSLAVEHRETRDILSANPDFIAEGLTALTIGVFVLGPALQVAGG